MQFAHTWEWVIGLSPHTGLPKTQTRRPVKTWEGIVDGKVGAVRVNTWGRRVIDGAPRFRVGQIVAVQPGRGKKAIGHIEILAIGHAKHAEQISPADAVREGFANVGAFCNAYQRINGADALFKPCWILTFRLVKEESSDAHL